MVKEMFRHQLTNLAKTLISAKIQSGQSKSPQNWNLLNRQQNFTNDKTLIFIGKKQLLKLDCYTYYYA